MSHSRSYSQVHDDQDHCWLLRKLSLMMMRDASTVMQRVCPELDVDGVTKLYLRRRTAPHAKNCSGDRRSPVSSMVRISMNALQSRLNRRLSARVSSRHTR